MVSDDVIFKATEKGREMIVAKAMHTQWNDIVIQASGADSAKRGDVIQTLWSGYGEIVRYELSGAEMDSLVVKHVQFPSQVNHPRGWHNDHAHQRKVKSYEVEMAWYHDWAMRCDEHCRVPHCYASETIADEHLIILEDLDAAGFPLRKTAVDLQDIQACLSWLANFHAEFMAVEAVNLWPVGSYWHLATRLHELAVMDDDALRDAAPVLDSMLNNCRYKTLIHGDAKLANFCFAKHGAAVAAVDFQYIGAGCGMKDVAYLLGSCLSDREQVRYEAALLNDYFTALKQALQNKHSAVDCDALETEWRALFTVAQADFYRFLVGWMPTHWKINDYNKRITQAVLARL